ncbi:MAG: polysaccharide deacetylase family protein [Oscillospiraceae bacterium]
MRVGKNPDEKNNFHYPRGTAAVRLVAVLSSSVLLGVFILSVIFAGGGKGVSVGGGKSAPGGNAPVSLLLSGDDQARRQTEIERQKEDTAVKKIALTYDDGPDPVYTEELLAVLEAENVRATFFLLGQEIAGQEETVKKMYAAGHILGNHTYSHVDLLGLSEWEALEQLRKTNEVIAACTGEYPQYFRPPFGRCSESINKQISMLMIMWTLDTRDWECQDTGVIVENIVQNVKENDIILMHDGYETTVEATRQVIPILKEQGYTFVTVEELMCP